MCAEYTKKSYFHENNERNYEWITIPMLLDQYALERPDHEAFVVRMQESPRESITFKQLKGQTEIIGEGLLRIGLIPGDLVMLTGDTCLNWILFDIACVSIGVIPIRARMSVLSKEGLEIICNHNNVKALFFNPGEKQEFENHLRKCIPSLFKGKNCDNIPSLKYLITMKHCASNEFVSCREDIIKDITNLQNVHVRKSLVCPEDICSVYMTSGSTGFPKAIPYTHFHMLNLYRNQRLLPDVISKDDRFLNERSMSWMGSFFHAGIACGFTIVYVHPMTNASDKDITFCLKVIQEEKVTSALFLQYLINDIVEKIKFDQDNSFHMRWIFTGGEVIQKSTIETLSTLCDNIILGYGTTECGFLASNKKTDDFDTLIQYAGYVEKGVEIKVVDDEGKIIPMGESGEIVVRSPYAFKGYLQKESRGMVIDQEGWIKTDDAGSLNENGYLKVFGRKSHVISRGITLTYPAVVERIILNCNGVAKVAVIGVPDKRLGQNICACIVPNDDAMLTPEKMTEYFDNYYRTDEGLGMTPAYFMFMDEFPILNGKINRKVLTRKAIDHYNLE